MSPSHGHISASEGYFQLEMVKTGFRGCKMATVSANADQFLFKRQSGLSWIHWNYLTWY